MAPLVDDRRIEALTRWLTPVVTGDAVRGAVIAIGDREGNEAVRPLGVAGPASTPAPMERSHRFLLTSVTKTFTATQVLQLVEDGALDLDAPVKDYIPECAQNGKERVTTRHLLTHTSGIDLTSNTTEARVAHLDPEQHLANALAARLSFEPGAQWQYCSPGYWILAELVTRLTGRSYVTDACERIFDRLGMADTRYEPHDDFPSRYVYGIPSETHGKDWFNEFEYVRRLAYPAGGLVSTASDLLSFGRSFLTAGNGFGSAILSAATVARLYEPWAKGWYEGRRVTWSLGWELGGPGTLRSERSLFHSGGSGTGLWIDPDNGVVVALLTITAALSWSVYAQVCNGLLASITRTRVKYAL